MPKMKKKPRRVTAASKEKARPYDREKKLVSRTEMRNLVRWRTKKAEGSWVGSGATVRREGDAIHGERTARTLASI